VQPVDRPVFWALIRTPAEKQDRAQIQKDADAEAPVWAIADRQLSTRRYMEGDQFTIADIAVGAYARRWLGFKGMIRQPEFPQVERWFAELAGRPAFAKHLGGPMS
jgi:glutathione S-transferase